MKLLTGDSVTAAELCRFLGLPKNTREFTLHIGVNEIATVTVTYYPDDPRVMGGTITQKFKLEPLE